MRHLHRGDIRTELAFASLGSWLRSGTPPALTERLAEWLDEDAAAFPTDRRDDSADPGAIIITCICPGLFNRCFLKPGADPLSWLHLSHRQG